MREHFSGKLPRGGGRRQFKDTLIMDAPMDIETREAFLRRLRTTLHRLNRDARVVGLHLYTNKRQRARGVEP